MRKFETEISIEEFHKLSNEDQQAYAEFSENLDRKRAALRDFETDQQYRKDSEACQKELDASPYMVAARKEALEKEAMEREYQEQEDANDGNLFVRRGYKASRQFDDPICRDRPP